MGFYNIVLEGQQAEEYKARKAKESEKAEEEYYKAIRRSKRKEQDPKSAEIRKNAEWVEKGDNIARNHAAKYTELEKEKAANEYHSAFQQNLHTIGTSENKSARNRLSSATDNYTQASDRARKAYWNAHYGTRNPYGDPDSADAIERHMRRHPEQWEKANRISEAYGLFESVEFLND